jgi:hypothetical protein
MNLNLCLLLTNKRLDIKVFVSFLTMAVTQSSDFFVTLPSNSSLDYYRKNQPSNYKVKLPYPVSLNGKWEVGLAEITYLRSWPTISPNATFNYTSNGREVHRFVISEGYYETLDDLMEYMNNKMPKVARDNIKIRFNPRNNKTVVQLFNDAKIFWSDEQLRHIFGIRDYVHDKVAQKGDMQISKQLGPTALFVYMDIVGNSIVGDSSVPLLRIVPVEGSHGDSVTRTFDRLHYVPLRMNTFESIEVNISQDNGSMINFQFGTVIIKLHFRPRRLPYL